VFKLRSVNPRSSRRSRPPESAVIEVESAVWEAPIPAYREALTDLQQPEHAFAGNLGG
jgi:hypothetical protein